ncbi:hypothetical protein DSOL_0664 [Desulfosporosinus metallidurans]|uniref:Uncharacterized protein n=1 Tax=Desulfosporosinus metallidurans TaxID=1888891 RepID=A0A1Q8R1F1_9FIRM|nr:hypothetical protein DSOL_0664 [Desulfosporosinus metallidurans]
MQDKFLDYIGNNKKPVKNRLDYLSMTGFQLHIDSSAI